MLAQEGTKPGPMHQDDAADGTEYPTTLVGCISLQLPRDGAVAGVVLKHAHRVMQRLMDSHAPMVFKIGVTHNYHWRWGNDRYGYAYAREKYERMVVLYESSEPASPCMLEAALIHHYQGHSS